MIPRYLICLSLIANRAKRNLKVLFGDSNFCSLQIKAFHGKRKVTGAPKYMVYCDGFKRIRRKCTFFFFNELQSLGRSSPRCSIFWQLRCLRGSPSMSPSITGGRAQECSWQAKLAGCSGALQSQARFYTANRGPELHRGPHSCLMILQGRQQAACRKGFSQEHEHETFDHDETLIWFNPL